MPMFNNQIARKVLTIHGERPIKNLLTLAKKLDSQRVVTARGGLDLSTISRRQFDTAILDLRYTSGRPAGRGYGFGEVRPNIVGNVLIINAEVNNLETFELAEGFIYGRHTVKGMLMNLISPVRSLVGRRPSPSRI